MNATSAPAAPAAAKPAVKPNFDQQGSQSDQARVDAAQEAHAALGLAQELGRERHRDRSHHRATDTGRSPDHQHRHDQERLVQIEVVRGELHDEMRPECASDR